MAIVTNAGGVGIQTVDDLEKNGLNVASLTKKTQDILKKNLPKEASIENPVDLLGDALAERYKVVLKEVIKDKNIDGILVILTPQQVTESLLTARYVNEIADAHNKTVVTSFVGGDSLDSAVKFLAEEKIPQFSYPNDAARTLGLIWEWTKNKEHISKKEITHNSPTFINSKLKGVGKSGSAELEIVQNLFRKYEIPLLLSGIKEEYEDILELAKNIEFPVVMKLAHPDLVHKTEFQAVRLDIKNAEELKKHFDELHAIAKKQRLVDRKFELQPYIKDKIELIIGVKKDADIYKKHRERTFLKTKGFGHVLLFGGGGIYTEIYKDVSLRILPVSRKDVESMIDETKIGEILNGARGKEYNRKAVVDLLLKLSDLMEKNTNITALDINPLFVTPDKAVAVDIKLFV